MAAPQIVRAEAYRQLIAHIAPGVRFRPVIAVTSVPRAVQGHLPDDVVTGCTNEKLP
jgi:hypothetical protein